MFDYQLFTLIFEINTIISPQQKTSNYEQGRII